MRAPKPTLSLTLSHSNSAPRWNTMPRSCPGPRIGSSPSLTSPEVGARNPAMMLSSVVLPQPDGPSRVSRRPGSSVKDTSARASTWPPSGSS